LIVVLELAFRGHDKGGHIDFRWLWTAPAIFALWANTRAAIVAGICIFATYLTGRGIQVFVRSGLDAWLATLHLAVILFACLLATLLNPYGLKLHLWLGESLAKVARPELYEWGPPHHVKAILIPWLALLLVTVASLLSTREKLDWSKIVVLLAVAWQSALHLRHIPFLALLCGFWLPQHVHSSLANVRERASQLMRQLNRERWPYAVGAIVLCLPIAVMSLRLVKSLREIPVCADDYPVEAIRFMRENSLHGKAVVAFNWAQYAIAALSPQVQVSFDGRYDTCYPDNVIDMNGDFMLGSNDGRRLRSSESGPIAPLKVLEYCKPTIVLLDRRFKTSVDVMRTLVAVSEPKWVLLYQDAIAQIWGRRDVYDAVKSPNYVEPAQRRIGDSASSVCLNWPALPDSMGSSKVSDGS
jgi:hypothetical protein